MAKKATLKTRTNETLYPQTVADTVLTTDNNNVQAVLNSYGDRISAVESVTEKNKGWFASENALLSAYPNNISHPENRKGWYAIVAMSGDDKLFIWDVDDNKWVNTDTDIQGIHTINGKSGTSVTLYGTDIKTTTGSEQPTITESLTSLGTALSTLDGQVIKSVNTDNTPDDNGNIVLNGSNLKATVTLDNVATEDEINDHLQTLYNKDVSLDGDISTINTTLGNLGNVAFSDNYNQLLNKPIINADLSSISNQETNVVYCHTGTTTSDFIQYQLYFYAESEWHRLGESGGTKEEIKQFFTDNPSFVYSGSPMYLKDLAGKSLMATDVQAYITALLATFDFEDAEPAQIPYDVDRWAVLQSANTTTYTIEYYIQDDGQIYSLAPNSSYVLTQTFKGFIVDKYTKSEANNLLLQKQDLLNSPATADKVLTSTSTAGSMIWADKSLPKLNATNNIDLATISSGVYEITGNGKLYTSLAYNRYNTIRNGILQVDATNKYFYYYGEIYYSSTWSGCLIHGYYDNSATGAVNPVVDIFQWGSSGFQLGTIAKKFNVLSNNDGDYYLATFKTAYTGSDAQVMRATDQIKVDSYGNIKDSSNRYWVRQSSSTTTAGKIFKSTTTASIGQWVDDPITTEDVIIGE